MGFQRQDIARRSRHQRGRKPDLTPRSQRAAPRGAEEMLSLRNSAPTLASSALNPNSEGGLAGTEPSACRADILVCRFTELSSSVSGDWKVACTGRLESLPHTTDSVPTSEFGLNARAAANGCLGWWRSQRIWLFVQRTIRAELRLDPSLPRLSLWGTRFDATMNLAPCQPDQPQTAHGLVPALAARRAGDGACTVAMEVSPIEGDDW